jgi:glycosyltransferase domain-containing protein
MIKTSKDLTLVLSMFGRKAFSERFFEYLELIKCPYPIIFADGNADGYGKNLVRKFSNSLDITHIEHKQTEKFIHYYEMQVLALRAVKTPYSMLCDNDDFIFIPGIKKLIAFMKNNDDYISAGSPIALFQIDSYTENPYGKKASWHHVYSHLREQEPMGTWEEQVAATFLDSQPSFYNIFKRGVLLQIWEEIHDLNFTDLSLMEFYYQLRAPTFGKQLDDKSLVHYLRQFGAGTYHQHYDYGSVMVQQDAPRDIRLIGSEIGKIIEKIEPNSGEKVKKTILESYATHLNLFLPHAVLRYRFKKAYQFKQKLLGLWGRMTVFQNIFFTLKEFRLKRQLKYNLLDEIYSDFTEEMDRIKNFLQR